MTSLFYASAAAAVGSWVLTLAHTFHATTLIHAPLWASNLSLRDRAVHYLCWHGMSFAMAAISVVCTLPLISPQTAILHRSAIILGSSIYAFASLFGMAECLKFNQPRLLLRQYSVLGACAIFGFITAYCIKA